MVAFDATPCLSCAASAKLSLHPVLIVTIIAHIIHAFRDTGARTENAGGFHYRGRVAGCVSDRVRKSAEKEKTPAMRQGSFLYVLVCP